MARRREDVDWYVEMSDALERRQQRRKWIVLALAVSLPLILMGGAVAAIYLHQHGHLERWFGIAKRRLTAPRTTEQPKAFDPVSVKKFQGGDIIYSQLDRNGFVTSISHFFREVGPNPDAPNEEFVVNRIDLDQGKIALYRLRNVGTGEAFEFRDVAVNRLVSGEWVITADGQKLIRDQLQARMRVQIRLIRK